ncbi:putative transferase family protein [Diplodia seriata]|uniref:Putative transferase family protein n=1 Tax=Diplodia seriata TaxID=420778 RepID=A0A0G2DSR3_9PEZI|nr:putative transferase family protein [Diplodia seriata]
MTLGALDQQVYPIVPIAVVFIYPGTPSTTCTSPAIPIPALKTALSHLLDAYPHLTGRLHISPTTGTRSIDRLGAGIHLHGATCASTLSSLTPPNARLTLPDLPAGGNALLAPYEPTLAAVCADRTPILSVQHTAFACGAVALGLRALHTVVDSDAFFQIVRDLAAVYRSLFPATTTTSMTCLRPADDAPAVHPPPPPPTPLTPYLAAETGGGGLTAEERHEALAFRPALFAVEDEEGKEAVPERYADKLQDATPTPTPTPPVEGRVMRFTRAQLAALKAAATATATPGDDDVPAPDAWVSTYDALSALVWTRVHAARVRLRPGKKQQQGGKEEGEEGEALPSRDFLTSVNYRERLALPARYPFNAVFAPPIESHIPDLKLDSI